MRLIFCVREHTFDEIYMGHPLGYPAIQGVDAISATANARGFTPLTAIARTYGWQREYLEMASADCNRRQEIAVVSNVTPSLLLVPKTRGDGGWLPDADRLLIDLLAAVKHLRLRSLHFTHFGFLQGRPPVMEMRRLLELLLSPLQTSSLSVLYWDIDRRGLPTLLNQYTAIARQYRLGVTKPEIYMAPTYEWREVDRTPGGHSVHEFVEQRPPLLHRFH
jgi:hypothetical protein